MERRELEHRRKEFQREDIINQLKKDSVINGQCSADERVENKRRLIAQKMRQEELKTHQDLIQVSLMNGIESKGSFGTTIKSRDFEKGRRNHSTT